MRICCPCRKNLLEPSTPHSYGMHPTADTMAVIYLRGAARLVMPSVSWYTWILKSSNQSAFTFPPQPSLPRAGTGATASRCSAALRPFGCARSLPRGGFALWGRRTLTRPARRVFPPIERASHRQQTSETGRGAKPLPARVRTGLNRPQSPTSRSFLAITSFLISAVRESNASSSGR